MDIELRGVQETIRQLREFGEMGANRIRQVTAITANEIVTDAARNLQAYPDVDPDGTIAQSINAIPKNGGITWSIAVNQVPMGAYIEFGTGVYVDIPPGWEDIAWQFYVNGRGRLLPHPYLYPAYSAAMTHYSQDLRDALDGIIRRYSN